MLTSAGRATVVAALALGALGYVLGYGELVAAGTGCLLAVALALLVVFRPAPVSLSREIAPIRVPRGDTSVGVLTVTNLSRRGQRISAAERCGGVWLPIDVPRIRGRGMRTSAYRLPTQHRGVFDVGPLRWERSDLLGLVRRRHALGTTDRIFVHPRTYSAALPASGRVRQLESNRTETATHGTITFHTLREYAPGDDMRSIHWRSSARLGELMVREHIDTALPQSTVVLDTRSSSYDEESQFEEAVDFASSLVVSAIRARSPLRLVTTGNLEFVAGGGDVEIREFLDQMAAVEPSDSGFSHFQLDIGDAFGSGVLVAVGGRMDAGDLSMLRALAHRHAGGALVQLVAERAGDRVSDAMMQVLSAPTAVEMVALWNHVVDK